VGAENKGVLGKKILGPRREEATEGRTSLCEMGGACGIHGQKDKCIPSFWWRNNKIRIYWEDFGLVRAMKQYWMDGSTHY